MMLSLVIFRYQVCFFLYFLVCFLFFHNLILTTKKKYLRQLSQLRLANFWIFIVIGLFFFVIPILSSLCFIYLFFIQEFMIFLHHQLIYISIIIVIDFEFNFQAIMHFILLLTFFFLYQLKADFLYPPHTSEIFFINLYFIIPQYQDFFNFFFYSKLFPPQL